MIELISDTIIEFEKDINSNNFVIDSLKTKVDDSFYMTYNIINKGAGR